jgi:N-acyl-D-amino-acid deacylase
MHDLVIKGGTVVDGTGAPARTADVAVSDGLVVEVRKVDGASRRTLHADGALVTPGFVDVHTHFDGQATWDPHLTPSCWHGVTTAVLGNCGVGFAPADPARRQWLIELMEGVEDIPGTALYEGIQWNWESFPEYLDALDAMPRALDVGTHVPHAALRAYVMGERAHQDATAEDLDAMCRMVTEAMEAGALGFSSGRTGGHKDVHGRPVPGTYAAESELEAILGAMDAAGRGVFQVVPHGIGGAEGGDPAGAMDAELPWLLRLAEATKRPMTYLVLESPSAPDSWRPWFDASREVNARGANLRPQVGSRCFGVLLGHQSRLNPFRLKPSYVALKDLPFEQRIARLRDPEMKARVLAEEIIDEGRRSLDLLAATSPERIFPLGDPLDYEPTPGDSIAAIAAREGRDTWEVMYDVLLGSDGREFLLLPLLNYGRNSYDGVHDMLADPISLQGLGDGGAHCGVVCDASMTTYLLSHWTRARTRGPQLPLEYAVHRLTADPARFYGMHDRGVLAPGMQADINVIDHDRLRLLYPERVHDLPAGAGRLIQRSEGYLETIVRGETVVAAGELTDARPGRLVRR